MHPLEWLIVGGGLHGTHLSHVLMQRGGVPADRVRVLDPYAEPMACWNAFTSNTGMQYLRSPAVHHLGLHPQSLARFARRGGGKKLARFVPPYDRPGLAFFRAHVDSLIAEHHLADVRIRGRAVAVERHGAALRVETEEGSLEARRVVLALGLSEQPEVPPWAASALGRGARVDHLFDPSFRLAAVDPRERIVVVGGGITAAQAALSLTRVRPERVTLVARHAPREHRFDSDPGWLGPKRMAAFDRTASLDERRRMIVAARNRGSIPPEVLGHLRHAKATGLLRVHRAEVVSLTHSAEGWSARLHDASSIACDRVVLATGFARQRPGGAMLDRAIEVLGLPCAACGYPIASRGLSWTSTSGANVYVTGPLAELELGPSSRNIVGARHAAERLLLAA